MTSIEFYWLLEATTASDLDFTSSMISFWRFHECQRGPSRDFRQACLSGYSPKQYLLPSSYRQRFHLNIDLKIVGSFYFHSSLWNSSPSFAPLITVAALDHRRRCTQRKSEAVVLLSSLIWSSAGLNSHQAAHICFCISLPCYPHFVADLHHLYHLCQAQLSCFLTLLRSART